MNPVHVRITAFYHQMEEAQSEEEKIAIKQARQVYYDQLSEEDQRIARKAAEPFLDELIERIKQEVDPLMERYYDIMERINARNATAYTTESADRPAPHQ
jgi:glutamyl-tRNA reductase